jgi:NADH-quinone oxidoreductase subunit N
VKAAAFAAFVRVWLEAFPVNFGMWYPAVSGLAIATMIAGNAIGLAQRNIKRLLAYSSIGHAGYLLVAVAAGTFQGSSAMLFYLFVYTLATFGAFAVITTVAKESDPSGPVMIDDFAGLWSVRPWLALAMGVLMLALLGFPVFGGAGFFAKWYVLQAALQTRVPMTTLAVVLVLTTVVSAGYYLYVVMVMFMRSRPADAPAPSASGWLTQTVLATSVAAILALGILPEYFFRVARAGRPRAEVTPAMTQAPGRPDIGAILSGAPSIPDR